MKSSILIPCDHLVQVLFAGYFVAVRVLEDVHVFHIADDIDLWSRVAYIYGFWQASILAAHKFPGTWLTCSVITHSDANTINRAKNVSPLLRPMVRHTWSLQARNDMVIRAKKGMCCRELDNFVAQAVVGKDISYKDVPQDHVL